MGHFAKPVLDNLRGKSAEIVSLAAGQNRDRQLVGLRRGKNEDDIGRGLFQGLEQGVEGCVGEHVDFVDDKYTEAPLGGRILHLVDDRANVIDAVVGRGIQFHDIEIGLSRDRAAGRALPAGIAVLLVLTVDRTRKNAGDRRLAGPSRPAEKVTVPDSARYDLVL